MTPSESMNGSSEDNLCFMGKLPRLVSMSYSSLNASCCESFINVVCEFVISCDDKYLCLIFCLFLQLLMKRMM